MEPVDIAVFNIPSQKIPCSEEEKETYGVDFKNDKPSGWGYQKVVVQESKIEDTGSSIFIMQAVGLLAADYEKFYLDKDTAIKAAKARVLQIFKNQKSK